MDNCDQNLNSSRCVAFNSDRRKRRHVCAIGQTVSDDFILSWSHYLLLIEISNPDDKFIVTNLKDLRQCYLVFRKSHTLCDQLSWSHYLSY